MNKDDDTSFEYAVIEEINLDNCCRACMQSDCALTSIDSADQDAVFYHDKLTYCIADINWCKDGLSTLICNQCIPNLRIAYDFIKTCLATDETFKGYLFDDHDELSNEHANDNKETLIDTNEIFISNKKLVFETCRVKQIPVLQEKIKNNEHLNQCVNEESNNETKEREGSIQCSSLQSATDFLESPFSEQDVLVEESDFNDYNFENHNINSSRKTPQENEFTHYYDLLVKSESLITDEKETAAVKTKQTKDPLILDLLESNKDQTTENAKHDDIDQIPASEIIIPASIKDTDNPENSLPINKRTKIKVSLQKKVVSRKTTKVHECDVCKKVYSKNANLKIHQRTHTGEKPFECQYCEKRFHHSSHRKEHERRHTNEKRFLCEVCNKRFIIKGELNMHMKSHTGEKNHHCTKCDRRCLTATDLKIHLRTHTGEKPYQCQTCGKYFASPYILSVHMKTHTGVRPFSCKACDKTFTQGSHLKVHMRKHTGEKFHCKFCSELFSHASQVSAHIRKEHGGNSKVHKCPDCDRTFQFPNECIIHINKKHTGQKYTCQVCDKQFTSPWYLGEHVRIHTGDKLHVCTICSKSFTRNQYLVKHIRTHTGERPYTCETCEKSFTQQSSLKIHMRIHTGERSYPCEICEKTFATKSVLTAHQKVHNKHLPGKRVDSTYKYV